MEQIGTLKFNDRDDSPDLRDGTFNEIGLAALSSVWRKSLWFDEDKMFAFATAEPNRRRFHDLVYSCDEPNPSLAPSAVARWGYDDLGKNNNLVGVPVQRNHVR